MVTSLDDKSALRRKFKALRREQTGTKAVDNLTENLTRFLLDYQDVARCLYRGKGHEAPCLLEPFTEFYFPVLNGTELEFRRPESADAFQANAFDIFEPLVSRSTPLKRGEPAVVCCPAVAVDMEGQRLGMGKGYYDRFFARHPEVLRVGVVFHIQISATPLPAESWDQALDWIVSEKMILRTSTSQRSSQSWI